MKYALPLLLLLAACQEPSVHPATPLPPFPDDLAQCLRRAGVEVPNRPLTAGEVERMWATDRMNLVAKRQCGDRAVAWYNTLRAGWR